ncbi:MAG: hypothetical protein MJE12_24920 [Alphaproteobacteria bacterium]|nr:hypothetical protein [Alphaproteobacteria bacterium]
MTDISFADWVDHCFDHKVGGLQWYFDPNAPFIELPAATAADYLTRLFRDPGPSLDRFSNEQLNQGLWYLIDSGGSAYVVDAMADAVPPAERIGCIEAMFTLFEAVFAARCSEHLSHIDEPGADPLNAICYMWWDIMPFVPKPEEKAQRPIDSAVLDVMRRTLILPHVACQENALHGLGHWAYAYPRDVARIVDDFLAKARDLRPDLRQYAENAKIGYVN